MLARSSAAISFASARFSDPTEHARAMPRLDQSYRQLGAGRFEGALTRLDSPDGIELCRERMNVPMQQDGCVETGYQLLGLALRSTEGTLDNEITEGCIAHLGSGRGFDSHSQVPPDFMTFLIPNPMFAELAEYLDPEGAARRRRAPLRSVGVERMRVLRAQLSEELRLLEDNAALLNYPAAGRLALERMLEGVFSALANGAPPRIDITRLSYRTIVRRSREYVLAHRGEAVGILDLCRLLRISRRTLQTSFLETAGIAPNAYLRAVRLAEVRDLLRRTSPEQCGIADAAAQFGFLHPSKFAAAFREMFGCSPSQVARR